MLHHPYLQIHICVLLWGFTAIFGKLISLPALPLVCWRMLLVTCFLLLWHKVWVGLRKMTLRQIASCCGVSLFVALHWLTFYTSIKLANASLAATCMALCAVFMAIVEPLLLHRPFDWRELILGLLAIPGVMLVMGGIPVHMQLGFWVGALSALLSTLFGVFNKQLVEHIDPPAVTFIEMSCGGLLLMILALLSPYRAQLLILPHWQDWLWLIMLAFACTLVPFTLALVALKKISAFTAQLAVNLEPLYAIVLAVLFLDEQRDLSLSFYLGVAIILGAVFIQPLWQRKKVR